MLLMIMPNKCSQAALGEPGHVGILLEGAVCRGTASSVLWSLIASLVVVRGWEQGSAVPQVYLSPES